MSERAECQIVQFPAPYAQRARGDHEVFVCAGWRRGPRGRRWRVFSIEESRVGADWWGWVAYASTFHAAVEIAMAHLEPGGVIEFLERTE